MARKKKTSAKKKRAVKKKAAAKKKSAGKKKAAVKKARVNKTNEGATTVDSDWAKRAVERYEKQIMNLLPKGQITGIGIGRRIRKGRLESEMTIRVYVDKPEHKEKLRVHPDFKKYYGGLGSDIEVSSISTAAGANDIPDGAKISNEANESGTLGTKVFADVGPDPKTVWLTAAHLASKNDLPSSAVKIDDGSGTIGTISPGHCFRNAEVDAAYIEPTGGKLKRPKRRVLHHPTTDDIGKIVRFNGAQTKDCTGEITDLFYKGRLTDTGEDITDHLYVRHIGSTYAKLGDSGAVVYLDGEVIGILRAADEVQKRSAVSKLKNLAVIAASKGKGFTL